MSAIASLARGHVVFCDDIRVEASGKLILVGVYLDEMQIEARPPVKIDTLSLIIEFAEPAETETAIGNEANPTRQTTVRVSLSNSLEEVVIAENNFDLPEPQSDRSGTSLFDPDGSSYTGYTSLLRLKDLQITQPSWLKVRAIRGDTVHKLGALHITLVNPSSELEQP